jgi:intracellular septation protein
MSTVEDGAKPPEIAPASEAQGGGSFARLAIELGPLLVFFGANAAFGIYAATGTFMVATFIALGVAWLKHRKIPAMLILSGAIVLVFGGLTLYLRDETFIKLKPTIVYAMFAAMLLVGLWLKRPLLQLLFGAVFSLTAEGWRRLTWRWVWFFLAMAVLNEIVWRNFSTDFWVSFKVFGFLPTTFIFAMAQAPLLQRFSLTPAPATSTDGKPQT